MTSELSNWTGTSRTLSPGDLSQTFTQHFRAHGPGWGLAWFLAAELVARFGTRIGLRALPLHRENLGWYGIRLDAWSARRAHYVPLGHLSACGDAERWEAGTTSGYDRAELSTAALAGTAPMELVRAAVMHLGLLERAGTPPTGTTNEIHGLVLEVLARTALYTAPSAFDVFPPAGYADDRRPELPVFRLVGHGDRFVDISPSGSLNAGHRCIDIVTTHLSGTSTSEIAGTLTEMLGLSPSQEAVPNNCYTLMEHRHRFACWAAGRAASRKLAGGSNRVLRIALESSTLPALLAGPRHQWPKSATEYDQAHRRWCEDIVGSLHRQGVDSATYGRAAKLVAIYIKSMIVCGGESDARLADIAHPPIDRLLLQALAKEPGFPVSLRALWRSTSWTALCAEDYYVLIGTLRRSGVAQGGFWRAERWWSGDGG